MTLFVFLERSKSVDIISVLDYISRICNLYGLDLNSSLGISDDRTINIRYAFFIVQPLQLFFAFCFFLNVLYCFGSLLIWFALYESLFVHIQRDSQFSNTAE